MPLGSIAAVPMYDIMHDEVNYNNANSFDGTRFMSNESKPGRTTDINETFLLWGYGPKAWYVAHIRISK